MNTLLRAPQALKSGGILGSFWASLFASSNNILPPKTLLVGAAGCTKPILSPMTSLQELMNAIWLIKRTFQPSVLRRKRKWGFLERNSNKAGRKIIARRQEKGRKGICLS
ncbi:unnamed protein product [Heterosigma akashiwo]|mmetsp:Transcript_4244/g.5970  ORF Transcript_4244/g.5970 Transcript_4244/m.5970 type:complete len:110 (-) Transcript_4244:136-465(-)